MTSENCMKLEEFSKFFAVKENHEEGDAVIVLANVRHSVVDGDKQKRLFCNAICGEKGYLIQLLFDSMDKSEEFEEIINIAVDYLEKKGLIMNNPLLSALFESFSKSRESKKPFKEEQPTEKKEPSTSL